MGVWGRGGGGGKGGRGRREEGEGGRRGREEGGGEGERGLVNKTEDLCRQVMLIVIVFVFSLLFVGQLHSSRITSLAWQTFQLDCIHRPSEVRDALNQTISYNMSMAIKQGTIRL